MGAEKVFHSTHAFHNDKEIISLHLPQPTSHHTETQWMLLRCVHCSVRPPRASACILQCSQCLCTTIAYRIPTDMKLQGVQ